MYVYTRFFIKIHFNNYPYTHQLYLQRCMKKLDWYIIKNFLVTFFFSIALFIVITVIIDASEKTEDFVRSKLGFVNIMKTYYLGFIPHITALLFPLFVFIAVIFFTSRMASRTEIVAILASGVSYNRWLKPYIMGGCFLGILLWIGNFYFIPKANELRTSFEARYVDINSSYENTIKNVVNVAKDKKYFKIDSFTYAGIYNYDTATKASYNFFSYKVVNNKVIQNTRADRMAWDTIKKANQWKIYNATERLIDDKNEVLKTITEKPLQFNVQPAQLIREKYTKDKLTTPQLAAYIETEKKAGAENINELLIEYGRRNATPVTVLLLTLIGAIVAGKKVRGGSGSHLAVGFVVAALFILADKFSTVFCTKGNLPASIAVWIPNVVFGLVAIYLYKKAPK